MSECKCGIERAACEYHREVEAIDPKQKMGRVLRSGLLDATYASVFSSLVSPYARRQCDRMSPFLNLFNSECVEASAEERGRSFCTFNADLLVGYGSYYKALACIPWATYRDRFDVSDREVVGDDGEVFELFAEKCLGAMARIVCAIEFDAIAGTGVDAHGNPTLIGLYGGAIGTGAYAGIAPSGLLWDSTVVTNGGVGHLLTQDFLASADRITFASSGGEPWNVMICGADVPRRYEGLFNTVAGDPLAGTLAGSLYWKGCPVVRPPCNPAGQLAMINTNHIKFKHLVPQPTPAHEQLLREYGLEPNQSAGEIPATSMPFQFACIAREGGVSSYSVRLTLAMCVTRRNAHALIRDIAV